MSTHDVDGLNAGYARALLDEYLENPEAVPSEWRLSVTAYPDIRLGDAQETLLHELVHLHVGTERGHRRWHGRRFKRTLYRAMTEGYGLRLSLPRSALHGTYAEALERLHARRLADANAARQLQLPLTG